jgi:predicted transposase YdaD
MNVLEEVQAMYSRWEQETVDRGRKEGRTEGRKEGHKEGERAALLRLLERRFGALPEAVTARVADASTNEIESWLDRVLDASSLDDVLAG